jgi:hypothetical protein
MKIIDSGGEGPSADHGGMRNLGELFSFLRQLENMGVFIHRRRPPFDPAAPCSVWSLRQKLYDFIENKHQNLMCKEYLNYKYASVVFPHIILFASRTYKLDDGGLIVSAETRIRRNIRKRHRHLTAFPKFDTSVHI